MEKDEGKRSQMADTKLETPSVLSLVLAVM